MSKFIKRLFTVNRNKWTQLSTVTLFIVVLCMFSFFSNSLLASADNASIGKADYVVVKKAERKLYLYNGSELLKTYKVALGKEPDGHKLRSGDSRTPEGTYTLDWRNPNSKFFRAIHISYPNSSDRRDARERGDSPGGAIMIHGQPNSWVEKSRLLFHEDDWTEGCIAVQNHEMMEIWNAVEDGTLIEIIP